MEQRRVGNSGLRVSAIGLGGNTFGETVKGEDAIPIIHRALDLGITYVDTGTNYVAGRSEELIGKALIGRRHQVVLGTKAGQIGWNPPSGISLSRSVIVQAVEDSLKRLQTDYIDLHYAHFPDPETPLEETLRAQDDLVRQGKVRYIACSNHDAWQVASAVGIQQRLGLYPWVCVQNRWNLIQGLEDPTIVAACGALGLGIVPYTPLASGILTGKYRRGEAPPPGTRLGDVPRVRARFTDADVAAAERVRPWAEARGHTVAELAIAWLLAYREVSSVIVGARSPEQVEQNVKGATWAISAEERDEVARLARG